MAASRKQKETFLEKLNKFTNMLSSGAFLQLFASMFIASFITFPYLIIVALSLFIVAELGNLVSKTFMFFDCRKSDNQNKTDVVLTKTGVGLDALASVVKISAVTLILLSTIGGLVAATSVLGVLSATVAAYPFIISCCFFPGFLLMSTLMVINNIKRARSPEFVQKFKAANKWSQCKMVAKLIGPPAIITTIGIAAIGTILAGGILTAVGATVAATVFNPYVMPILLGATVLAMGALFLVGAGKFLYDRFKKRPQPKQQKAQNPSAQIKQKKSQFQKKVANLFTVIRSFFNKLFGISKVYKTRDGKKDIEINKGVSEEGNPDGGKIKNDSEINSSKKGNNIPSSQNQSSFFCNSKKSPCQNVLKKTQLLEPKNV
jgi:hypothetical protein